MPRLRGWDAFKASAPQKDLRALLTSLIDYSEEIVTKQRFSESSYFDANFPAILASLLLFLLLLLLCIYAFSLNQHSIPRALSAISQIKMRATNRVSPMSDDDSDAASDLHLLHSLRISGPQPLNNESILPEVIVEADDPLRLY